MNERRVAQPTSSGCPTQASFAWVGVFHPVAKASSLPNHFHLQPFSCPFPSLGGPLRLDFNNSFHAGQRMSKATRPMKFIPLGNSFPWAENHRKLTCRDRKLSV